jgi:hypothetical protein
VKIDDSQLYAILAGLLDGEGRADVTPKNSQARAYSVEIGLEVHDNHRGDSPDVILHVAVTIDHPLLPKLKLHIPLPVEGEKAGIGAALEDLKKFSERGHFPQRLPMIVVGGSGNPARRSQQIMIPATFEIVQIPYRALSE